MPKTVLGVQLPLTMTHNPVGDECDGGQHDAQPSSCLPEKHEDAGTDVCAALTGVIQESPTPNTDPKETNY